MTACEVTRGASPVILAFPHAGTAVPIDIWEKLNENGRILADADWHIHTLYAELLPDATTVRATFHRYVIDANRDPEGGSLYPGQNTTGLISRTDFDGKAIWRSGQEPTQEDVAARLAGFHTPYHTALTEEIERVKAIHGAVVLYDCHSIRSRIPFLFDGTLPDFSIGTDDGRTCSPTIEATALEETGCAAGYTSVLNGRFKGGWTTRHYGKPGYGVRAIQMELAQSNYLSTETPPFAYDLEKAKIIRAHLSTILARVERTALELKSKETSP